MVVALIAAVALPHLSDAFAAPTPGMVQTTGQTTNVAPATDGTTTGWTTDGATACSTSCYGQVNDYPDSSSTRVVSPQLTACASVTKTITLKLPTAPSALSTMTGVKVYEYGKYARTGGTSATVGLSFRIYQSDGTTALTSSASTSSLGTSATTKNVSPSITGATSKSAWDNATLSMTTTATCVGSPTSLQTSVYSIQVQYTYTGASGTTPGTLSQDASIWEDDDGTSADTSSAQAAGNTAISSVERGERLTLRVQDSATTAAVSANLGLFYDRNDGYYTKVRTGATAITGAGSCASTVFACTTADSAGTAANETSVAVDDSGRAWVSSYDATNKHLKVATYVGTGGTGCGTSTAWACTTLTNGTGSGEGRFSSIGIDHAGVVWISYWDAQNSALMVAKSVAGSGCAVSGWTCTTVQTGVTMDTTNGDATSMTIDGSGTPWLAFHNSTSSSVYVLQYTNGSTDCSTQWTGCTTAVSTSAAGFPALALDGNLVPWASWYDGSGNLQVAKYVTSGGSCSSTAWSCLQVDTGSVGKYAALAIAPNDQPWVSYYDATNARLRVARYLGGATGGTGCSGTDATHWTCTTVDATAADVGKHTSIGFDPAGRAWTTYQDTTNGSLRLARNLSGSGCTSAAWSCSSVDTSTTPGTGSSLAFAPDGTAFISSVGTGSGVLRVARLYRSGEIVPTPGLAATNGASITQSHADMASAGDSSAKASANCTTGTWGNGKWVDSEEVSGLTIASGGCTEVAFVISTAGAQPSTTYRFVVASNDGWRWDKGVFRGPAAIASSPQLTVVASSGTRATKDASWDPANCTSTSWGCADAVAQSGMRDPSFAFDPAGAPWFSYRDDTGGAVWVAKYVGGTAGGSSCGASGSSAWSCTQIDASASFSAGGTSGIDGVAEEGTSLVFDRAGTPWISYIDFTTNSGLRVAHYVGSGGTGCSATSAWTCATIVSSGGAGVWADLAIDSAGALWMSYVDGNTGFLWVAHQTSTTGSGCSGATDTTWTCTKIVGSEDGGVTWSSLAIDPTGSPWVAYYTDAGSSSNYGLRVAHFVGQGGSGCVSGATAWKCENVDVGASGTTYEPGAFPNVAFDASGAAWIAFVGGNGSSAFSGAMVAKYVGASGSGCSSGVTAWSCWTVDSGALATNVGLAVDSTGAPWLAYQASTGKALVVATYVGSGGSCASSSAFRCTTVESSATDTLGARSSMGFAADGTAWVSYYDATTSKVRIARQHRSTAPLVASTAVASTPANGPTTADGRFRLDAGASPRGTCAAASGAQGYCAVAAVDAKYDAVAAAANEQPLLTFAAASASNATFPSYSWTGKSTVAPSSSGVTLEVYRAGATNAWVALASDTSTASGTNLTLTGTASAGTASEYWQSDGSAYRASYRVYQASSSSAPTLSTDQFAAVVSNQSPTTPTALAQFEANGTTGIPAATLASYDASVGSSADGNGGSLSISTTTVHRGSGSMKDVSSASAMWINDGASATRDLSANGPTFSAWVYVPSANDGSTWTAYLSIYDSSTVNHDGPVVNVARDTWTLIAYTPSTSLLQAMKYLVVAVGGGAGGTNTVYVDDLQQGHGPWTTQTGLVVSAAVGDADASDTDVLCIEVQPVGTAFTGTATSCGTGAAYSGSAVTVTASATLANGTSYHWQAQTRDAAGATSSWATYGGNSDVVTAGTDVAVDATAPTTGAVYDGSSAGVESSYNSGSLTSLAANWSGFGDAASGLYDYNYAIGTTAGGTDVRSWTSASATSVTASGLSLRTQQRYYVSVRARDLAGNVSAVVTSAGQYVAPVLVLSVSPGALVLGSLNASNGFVATGSLQVTATTNAHDGYDVTLTSASLLSSGSFSVAAYAGTWASPTAWSGTGFGFTSDDPDVGGANRFGAATKYAGVPVGQSAGVVVADRTTSEDGALAGAAALNDTWTLTFRLATSSTQVAGSYATTLTIGATARW